jgi:predicted butyrate kinase (DUF1464 family)
MLAGASHVAVAAGYGAPPVPLASLDDEALALALLPDPASTGGGIGGLRGLLRALVSAQVPAMLLPGIAQLPTVPVHRTLDRIDGGTADKTAVAALALAAHGLGISALVLELGGAFTAGVAIANGEVVDGIGGSAGPMGLQAGGALDGEVAMLLGTVTKADVFRGGRADAAARVGEAAAQRAWLEAAAKTARQLQVSAPMATTVLLSGRGAEEPGVRAAIAALLPGLDVRMLGMLPAPPGAKAAAQGAAVLADALAGGVHAPIAHALRLREVTRGVLDGLVRLDPAAARARLGLAPRPR